ncbi:hypothetical protein AB3X91_17020 [Paraburkholderia sp. BR14263]|uniref:hypothetical protein n=1 Tax=unclassified Paraburkholderia TaxID=2615204 RepID=UPI0034CD8DEB
MIRGWAITLAGRGLISTGIDLVFQWNSALFNIHGAGAMNFYKGMDSTGTGAMRESDGCAKEMFTMSKLADFVPASHRLRSNPTWLNDVSPALTTIISRQLKN